MCIRDSLRADGSIRFQSDVSLRLHEIKDIDVYKRQLIHLLSFFWFPSSCEVLRLYFTADIFVNLRLVLNDCEGDFLFLAELLSLIHI